MSHYFLALTLTVATPLCIISMERNVPQLDLTQTKPSNQPRRQPLTPRPALQAEAAKYLSPQQLLEYPAFQAYYLNEAINSGAFNVVFSMISNKRTLRGYEPAIIIRDSLEGNIKPDSPFYSQQIWEKWDNENSPLDKKNFRKATLYVLEETPTKNLREAHQRSIVYGIVSIRR